MSKRLTARQCLARFHLINEAAEHLYLVVDPDFPDEVEMTDSTAKLLRSLAAKWGRMSLERDKEDALRSVVDGGE